MLSNLSNKKLLIVFAVLLLIVVVFFLTDVNKNERTFRGSLVEIDSSEVTSIKIYPKTTNHRLVNLFRKDSLWYVALAGQKKAVVPNQKITGLIDQLLSIQPKRLAARDESKWSDFQVDSSGTHVVVYEGSDVALDIVLGKFSFKQPRSMSTFVRLSDEDDVYEVDGFLEMTFNQNADSFRDGTIIKDDVDNWSRLSFSYPADSSFYLVKQGNYWLLNNVRTDSMKIVSGLRQLSNISATEFADNYKPGRATHKLSIDSEKSGEIIIEGFMQGDNIYIRSSQNPEALFDASKNNLFERVFVSQNKFME